MRGTATLDLSCGKFGVWEFKLSGLWVDPADVNLPAPTLTTIIPPVFLSANAKIGTYVPVITDLKVDLGVTVQSRMDANNPNGLSEFFIGARKTTGSIDPEVDAITNYNPWAAWEAGSRATFMATCGTVAGNRIRVSHPERPVR